MYETIFIISFHLLESHPFAENLKKIIFDTLNGVKQLKRMMDPDVICHDIDLVLQFQQPSFQASLIPSYLYIVYIPMRALISYTKSSALLLSQYVASNPDLFVHAPSISNHSLIEGHLPIQPENVFEKFTTRSWRKFDKTKFKQDLFASNFFSQDSNWANFTIDELFSNYNLTLRTLLDKHLPVRKMTRRVDPLTPWFDADCVKAKSNVRRLERLYHRSSFMSDRIK